MIVKNKKLPQLPVGSWGSSYEKILFPTFFDSSLGCRPQKGESNFLSHKPVFIAIDIQITTATEIESGFGVPFRIESYELYSV